MNNINYKKILAFIFSFSLVVLLPLLISHAAPGGGSTIKNPLGENNKSVQDLLLKVMNLVAIVGGIVVVFFIIYSGYTLVMARGNPEGLKKGKEMLLATIIGGAILLGADVIANVVVSTVKATTGAK
jgi:membrane-anchored glycerophosphoryl diester phosphodiesterase (GDPDase)